MSFVGENIPVHPCVHSNGQLNPLEHGSAETPFYKLAISVWTMLGSYNKKVNLICFAKV